MEVPVSLSTICAGALEEQFQQIMQALIPQIKHGQKGSVSISIDFKRVENTTTMVTTAYKITPKFPAMSKASICQVTGDNRLKTEAAVERPKVVNLFNNGDGGNNNE